MEIILVFSIAGFLLLCYWYPGWRQRQRIKKALAGEKKETP